MRNSRAELVFLLERSAEFRNKFHGHSMKVGSGESYDLTLFLTPHQLAFDAEKKVSQGAGNEPI